VKFSKTLPSERAQSASGTAVTADDVDAWFSTVVLPLEPALMRFLRRNWSNPDEIADLRQDIYMRAYEAALRDGIPVATQAFVFACARNLLIDRARRAQVVPFEAMADVPAFSEQPDDFSPERVAGARAELDLLQAALNDLPPRCREVVVLRKIDELPQKEIADRLGIAEGTVEKHITLGIRALADALYTRGVDAAANWMRRMHRGEPEQ
jgi:RNA polymerase sigma-70 factor (ECF subfamily)